MDNSQCNFSSALCTCCCSSTYTEMGCSYSVWYVVLLQLVQYCVIFGAVKLFHDAADDFDQVWLVIHQASHWWIKTLLELCYSRASSMASWQRKEVFHRTSGNSGTKYLSSVLLKPIYSSQLLCRGVSVIGLWICSPQTQRFCMFLSYEKADSNKLKLERHLCVLCHFQLCP